MQYSIVSWNIDGLRPEVVICLTEYILENNPDVICLNETKKSEQIIIESLSHLKDYDLLINTHKPCHYHGVAMLIKKNIKYTRFFVKLNCKLRSDNKGEDASSGRIILVKLNDKINLLATYSPNSGVSRTEPLKNLDYRIKEWDASLFKVLGMLPEDTIWIGDINVAPEDIDVTYPKSMSNRAGFTSEERDSFKNFMSSGNWIDIWRHQHPNKKEYSYRGYGKSRYLWRLDNCVISKSLKDNVIDTFIDSQLDSPTDHVPIGIKLEIKQ